MHHQLDLLERRVSEAPPLQHREDPAMVESLDEEVLFQEFAQK